MCSQRKIGVIGYCFKFECVGKSIFLRVIIYLTIVIVFRQTSPIKCMDNTMHSLCDTDGYCQNTDYSLHAVELLG